MPLGPGSLKLVVAFSAHRALREPVERALRAHMSAGDIRHLRGDAFLIYTEAETATVRDWLAGRLDDEESALVVEFERWSSLGPAIDREWLLRRGH
jgi:hypothetical protein